MVSWLYVLTPINLDAEREKFLASNRYNPVLKYDWSDKRLSTVTYSCTEFSKLIDTVLTKDLNRITQVAQETFSVVIEPETLHQAQQILNKPTPLVNSQTLDQFSAGIRKAIDKLNLNYEIKVLDQDGFNVRPSHADRAVYVSKHINLHFFDIDGFIKHEISHLIRNVNNDYNKITAKNNAVATGEGLASYVQDYYGNNGQGSLYQHAAEYAATEIGLKGSLRDIYDFFLELGFSEQLAWQRSIRHKFGFIDTSKPGDIMKPAMYFYHEQKVKALTDNKRWRLFVGKIRTEDLPKYPEYIGKIPLEKLQAFYT